MNNLKFAIQICKGLIRDTHMRRFVMFYSVLCALVLLFLGSTFLWGFLWEHRLIFLGYWLACGWITLLAVLLAFYDLLRVRADVRRARRELEQEYIKKVKPEPHDENPS